MKQLFQCSLIYTGLNTGTIFNTTTLSTEHKLVFKCGNPILWQVHVLHCYAQNKALEKQSAHCVSLPRGCRQAWGQGVWNRTACSSTTSPSTELVYQKAFQYIISKWSSSAALRPF